MATIFPALAASASSVILPSATAASNDHMMCDDGDAAMVHMHRAPGERPFETKLLGHMNNACSIRNNMQLHDWYD